MRGVHEIQMTLRKYEFSPGSLRAKKGERVKLVLAATDHDHGFKLDDFNINQKIPEGTTVVVEFTADNRYAIATCEFSGQLVKIDLASQSAVGYLTLDPDKWSNFIPRQIKRILTRRQRANAAMAALMNLPSMPQDIRSSADGSKFYVADMKEDGVFVIDPQKFERIGFVPTGKGTHGIYPSRDGKDLYVTNRGWNTIAGGRHGPGSISVLDPTDDKVVATWPIPGGGSPDMGDVTADGKELWVSGRYDDEVYVFDTSTGRLTHRIPVGREPHGLAVWPQPGRYSLGHTGNMR